MKKSGLQIAAGVCEIIAASLWLLNILFIQQFANILGLKFGAYQYFILYGIPIAMIISGVSFCTGKRRKSQAITEGILGLVLVGLEFYWGLYEAFGILHNILLIIAACLLFFSKKPETETIKTQEQKVSHYSKSANNVTDVEYSYKTQNQDGDNAPVNNLTSNNFYSVIDDTVGIGSAVNDTMVNDDFTTQMIKLKELYDSGILTEEEYTRQKMDLMQQFFG